MRHKGSKSARFRQRIPLDVLDSVQGRSLDFPVGDQTIRKRVSQSAVEIVVHCADDGEARKRQATIITYLENVYQGLRYERPVEITHREAVALSGEFYRSWAVERDGGDSITGVEFDPPSSTASVHRTSTNPEAVSEVWGTAAVALGLPADDEADEVRSPTSMARQSLEVEIDRFLLGKGLRLTDGSREIVIHEVRRALGDAFENRQRNASGDYSSDPKANRFPPQWRQKEATVAASLSGPRVSLTDLIEALNRPGFVGGSNS